MPVSYEEQFVFFHIPRCGGTSIDSYYKFHQGNPLFGLRRRGNEVLTLQHLTYDEIKKERILTDETLQSFFKFTVVRDPFRRLISDYFWQKHHDIHDEFRGMRFSEFLDFAEKVINDNLYFKKIHYDHFRPMKEYCYTDDELVVEEILVLDRIEKDIERIHNRIGLDSIDKVNSSNPDLEMHSTKQNIDRVYEIYSEDKNIYEKVLQNGNLRGK